MACLTLQPRSQLHGARSRARSGRRASECQGLVVAHSDSIPVAHPGSLKACPKSLLAGKAGQVLELTWGVRWGHHPTTGSELWGQLSGPSSL